ncbi:exopolysaccharide biosynthesis protein [Brevundimonas balnearis]|uniref:Exopolysaccharide biosynthesis protein n=1 Tax=Brevundimonas balnearis TaxID=1572858 RepID=A0ABV6R3L4_9CAUL
MNDSPHPYDGLPFSEVLARVGARPGAQVSLEELVQAFGERGFGALLLLLGLISAVIGAIPGTTTILGLPMLILGVQLLFRRDELWLPGWILKREIERKAFADAASRVMPHLKRVERFSRPRLQFMSTDLSECLIGLACVIWAGVLMLPLIGFNLFPSLFVATFGFGLMQRDGVAVIAAWVGSAAFATVVWLAWEAIMRTIEAVSAWWGGLV